MLVRIFCYLLLTGLLPFVLLSQTALNNKISGKEKGYEITGQLAGLKEGEKVTMQLYYGKGQYDFVDTDSAYVKDGKFFIKGNVPECPLLYFLDFDQHRKKTIRVVIDNNDKLTIRYNTDIAKCPHGLLDWVVDIHGSESNLAWHIFARVAQLYFYNYMRLNNHLKTVKDSIGFNPQVIGGIMMSRDIVNGALFNDFLKNTEEDYTSGVLPTIEGDGLFESSNHAAFWVDYYNKLSNELQTSFYGKKLKKKIPLCVGQPLPEFKLPQTDGKLLDIKDVTGKNKVTLVHFYATNSFERNRFQGELRVLYKKYHNKGLDIIGVSSDNYMDQFKETLKAEQYPWNNVIDLKGKMVDSVYHELGNPEIHNTTNVLLDSQGKIIAWDVYSVDLQWYLWKYLGE